MPPKAAVQTKGDAGVLAAAGAGGGAAAAPKAGAKGAKTATAGPAKAKKVVVKPPIGQIRKGRKVNFRKKLEAFMQKYSSILIINIDNVSSNQLNLCRVALRSQNAEILMGKNTVVRSFLREKAEQYPKFAKLLEADSGKLLKFNIGFVFTNNKDLGKVSDVITAAKVPAPAKVGTIAPMPVVIPPGVTPLEPGQTAFFQALNIATKITRGAIEIISKVDLLQKGDKVTASAVALLGKLNLKPFFYGITVLKVYEDGIIYGTDVLSIDKSQLYTSFVAGIKQLTALARGANYLTVSTLPYVLRHYHNKLIYLCMGIDYSFPAADAYKPQPAAAEGENKEEKAEDKKDAKKSGSGSGSSSSSGSD